MNKRIRLYYYDTSGQLIFVCFLEEIEPPKNRFEINWPLQLPNWGHTMLPNSVEADMYYYIIPSNLPAHYSPAYKP